MTFNIDIKKEKWFASFRIFENGNGKNNSLMFFLPPISGAENKIKLYCKMANEALEQGIDLYRINDIEKLEDITADRLLQLINRVSDFLGSFLKRNSFVTPAKFE